MDGLTLEEQIIKIDRIIIHPQYDGDASRGFDVALVVLHGAACKGVDC